VGPDGTSVQVQLFQQPAPLASGMGSRGLARLHGLFAVYKPPGLKWKHVRDTVELQLLKGVNAGKAPAPEQRVRFLLGPVGDGEEKELTLTANSVPTLTNHPLGTRGNGSRPQIPHGEV